MPHLTFSVERQVMHATHMLSPSHLARHRSGCSRIPEAASRNRRYYACTTCLATFPCPLPMSLMARLSKALDETAGGAV